MDNEISLRDYMEVRFKDLEHQLDAQSKFNEQHFALNESAIKKAEDSMTLRLEGMNEFRAKIAEERKKYVDRDNLDVIVRERDEKFKGVYSRIDKLETTNAFSAGKMWMVMALFAAIPTILSIIVFIKK